MAKLLRTVELAVHCISLQSSLSTLPYRYDGGTCKSYRVSYQWARRYYKTFL